MRLSVVGLGPGPAEWVTTAALERLRLPGARVFARTRLLPCLETLLAGITWDSFDHIYDTAASLDEVHATIAERLLAAAAAAATDHDHQTDNVVLAVPGDGTLAEAILDRLRAAGASIEVVPGVPLGVGALAAAGLSAPDGAQFVEATALGGTGIDLLIELNPRWPAAVTGVFSRQVASDLKLALQRVYPSEHLVHVVRHPGLPDQHLEAIRLADLDRLRIDFDHLTHVVLPAVPGTLPTGSAHGLRFIVSRLRAPEIGCPWDLEQTHRSLVPYVIEEAYEVVDAIQADHPAELADELGDLLLQVVLHAELADQADEFDWNDVVRSISAKLVRRHPHVFGEVEVSGASEVVRNWDVLKAEERKHAPPAASALDGIPASLPALKRAAELVRKAAKAGFDWPTRQGTLDKVREELAELLAAESLAERREELGDLLYVVAKLAWQDGIDPEEALRGANQKFTRRFQALEAIARERGWSNLTERPLADLEAAWTEAKLRTP